MKTVIKPASVAPGIHAELCSECYLFCMSEKDVQNIIDVGDIILSTHEGEKHLIPHLVYHQWMAKKLKRRVVDAIHKTQDMGKIEGCAHILGV